MSLGIEEGLPPMVLAPLVPVYLSVKWGRRVRSLRRAGVKLRRVLLMPLARWVLPAPATAAAETQLLKLAPKELLDGPHGAAIRRAAEERAAVLDIFRQLPKADRAQLPEIEPTVNGLVERVVHLAQALSRLDDGFDPELAGRLEARIAEVGDDQSPDGQRRLALLRRQLATMEDLAQRRAALARQLDSAGLALENLRFDLIKLRSSGLQAAMADVSTATQEARALAREIGAVLAAADEVRKI